MFVLMLISILMVVAVFLASFLPFFLSVLLVVLMVVVVVLWWFVGGLLAVWVCVVGGLLAVCWRFVCGCKLFLRTFGAIFIIAVYLTASAIAVPEARSRSSAPRLFSLLQNLQRGHTRVSARIMIFCIKTY